MPSAIEIATVKSVTGAVFARGLDGGMRQLKAGDKLYEGETIVTQGGARVELTFADGRVFTVAFRHNDTAIEAEPVLGFPAQSDTDFYRLSLRLMQI